MKNIFANPRFVASVWRAGDIPAPPQPIIAFAGRSNAGKSSLINALCNAKTAKVSRTPGKTRMINIFQIQSRLLADMPGYGYAKVPLAEKRQWQTKMRAFLPQVNALVLVVDSRRGIGILDEEMLSLCAGMIAGGGEMVESGAGIVAGGDGIVKGGAAGNMTTIIIALTKADKLSRAKLQAAETLARKTINTIINNNKTKQNKTAIVLPNIQILPVSSNTGTNIPPLRTLLTKATT